MISAEDVLAAFSGATEITSREDKPDVDCWHPARHHDQHHPHPTTGRTVCFACHPPAENTSRESPLKPVTRVTEWAKGSFRGGPLDGHTHDVPKRGAAFIRWHDEHSRVHWYSIKPKTARTYMHLGTTPSEGLRSDLAPRSGEQLTIAPPAVQGEPIDMIALDAQVACIATGAPATSFIEVRALDPANEKNNCQIWVGAQDPDRTQKIADAILQLRDERSVYISCATRVRRSGRLDDVSHASCLWADCDSPESAARLIRFTPAPSLANASGRPGHLHGFWMLGDAIPAAWVRRANRRIALALGSDRAVTHPAAVLRPIGSINHRTGKVTSCAYVDRQAKYSTAQIVGRLPDEPKPVKRATSRTTRSRVGIDGLLRQVRNAPAGTDQGYNVTLHWAACRCAEHIARGELDPELAYDELYAVGLEVDLGERATRATLRSAGLT